MKGTIRIGTILFSLICVSWATVYQGHSAAATQGNEGASAATTAAAKPIDVGNKICPVSGEKVGQMG